MKPLFYRFFFCFPFLFLIAFSRFLVNDFVSFIGVSSTMTLVQCTGGSNENIIRICAHVLSRNIIRILYIYVSVAKGDSLNLDMLDDA